MKNLHLICFYGLLFAILFTAQGAYKIEEQKTFLAVIFTDIKKYNIGNERKIRIKYLCLFLQKCTVVYYHIFSFHYYAQNVEKKLLLCKIFANLLHTDFRPREESVIDFHRIY